MGDMLQRFTFEHAPVRGEIVQLDAAWRAVLERHDYPPPLQTLLGECMAVAALLAATLKFDGAMILQMHGSGPVKLLVVECMSDYTLRATAKWHGDVSEGPLARMLGDGRCVITLVPRESGQSYQGIVTLTGESIAEALQHYMLVSEQIDTRITLAADAARAAGMLLQRLPGAESEDADAWRRASILGATLTGGEILRLPASAIISRLFHEEDLRLFEPQPLAFRCSCTRERVSDMLRMLGRAEVESILSEHGNIEVDCEFCNRRYLFDSIDAEQLFAPTPAPETQSIRH